MNQPIPEKLPMLQVELAVWFADRTVHHGLLSNQLPGTQKQLREECAEVNIPVHTDEAIYVFVCFLGHLPNFVPAISEMAILKRKGDKLVELYGEHCKPLEVP